MNWREILTWLASIMLLTSTCVSASAKETPDEQLMTMPQARQFVLDMVNEERRSMGLGSVSLDLTASRAGQRHADQMAENMYMAHWDLLGKKPWERYNQAGGMASVAENVAYIGTLVADQPSPLVLPLVAPPLFSRQDLAAMEEAMFGERPPNDGHRKNILDPHHTGLGIGLGVAASGGWSRVTLDEEFTDNYGTFPQIASSLRKGLQVKGTLDPHVAVDSIVLEYEPTPHAMVPSQLNKTHSYNWPETTLCQVYPAGFHTDAPLSLTRVNNRQHFETTLPAMSHAQPGIYYVFVWAHKADSPADKFVASVRTVSYGPRASMPLLARAATVPTATGKNQPQHGTPPAAPDIKTLFFHPELVGSTSVPATVDRSGPPDLSKLFFQPTSAGELPSSDNSVKAKTSHTSGAGDTSELFFAPDGSNSNKGTAPASTKKNKADVRDLFFRP